MSITRAFKSGNSQAVRIPKELQFDRMDIELEIVREGDELRIRPIPKRLGGVLKKFSAFSKDFMAQGRERQEEGDREAL